jgi:hypothetical protein
LADISPTLTALPGCYGRSHDERVKIPAAMDAGVWFHTSHTYGDALQVLQAADQD